MIKTNKNILENKHLSDIQKVILSPAFPWYIADVTLDGDNENKQLIHHIYKDFEFKSSYFRLFLPVLDFLNPLTIFRMKLNLVPKTESKIYYPYHIDHPSENLNSAIFYINTNDGETRFVYDNIKIQSEENKIIRFPSGILHAGTTCTDKHFRVVLNIIYTEKNANK
jgi:hypothetical protein